MIEYFFAKFHRGQVQLRFAESNTYTFSISAIASLETFFPQKCVNILLVLIVGILTGAFLSFGFLGARGLLACVCAPEDLFYKYQNL